MTREIKFRGKKFCQDEWIYGSLITRGERGADGNFIDTGRGECYPLQQDTIGQFTGLHDKNGKEIYEGDIIAVNGIQIGYIVGGVRGYCYDVIYTPAKHNGEKAWPLYSVVTRDYPNKCEVIGNIHDNPELLKEE